VVSVIFAAATITLSVAIGVVCLIAGGMYLFRGRVLFGAVLLVIGLLLGGLGIFGAFG
jgi:ABC-type spermidine/putrescine transport system permease subunit II